MPYRYEDKLNQAAQEYIDKLGQAGIMANVVPGSMREFSLKISITKDTRSFGNVVLSYNPNKEQFSPKYHEMKDRSLEPELEAVWRSNAPPTEATIAATVGVEIYVDGSYVDGTIGYGAVIVTNGAVIKELSDRVPADDDPSLGEAHQVAGEIYGVNAAITWCQSQNIAEVTIAYDYAGLEQWATGSWRAKQPLTQEYVEFIQNCGVDISWRKVAAHTGQRWNERADELARQAATLPVSNEPAVDLATEVKQMAEQFATFLQAQGITAQCDGRIYNNQYARLHFYQSGVKVGHCDLYNTPKYRLDPRWQAFTDPTQQALLATLWGEFRYGHAEATLLASTQTSSPLSEVAYFYHILKPYADCAFDFIDLAQALARAVANWPTLASDFDPETARYNFQKLEAVYNRLRSNTYV